MGRTVNRRVNRKKNKFIENISEIKTMKNHGSKIPH